MCAEAAGRGHCETHPDRQPVMPAWLRHILTALLAACLVGGLVANSAFENQYAQLTAAAYDRADLSRVTPAGLIVAAAYRNVPWLNIYAAISTLGALILIALLSFGRPTSGRLGLTLPPRFVAPALVVLSFFWLLQDISRTGDLVSLDHVATGLLRYEEDSVATLFMFMLTTPVWVCAFVAAFFAMPRDRTLSRGLFRHINGLMLCLCLPLLAVTLLAIAPKTSVLYDHTSFHSIAGFGAILMTAYSCAVLVLGRAAQATARKA